MGLNCYGRMLTATALLLALAVGPTQAQVRSNGSSGKPGTAGSESAGQAQKTPVLENPQFTEGDREIIRVYYKTVYWQQNGSSWPIRANYDGSAGDAQVPIQRGISLPWSMRRAFKPFPPDLEKQLSPLPKNFARGWINYDVMIVSVLSYRVTDVLHDFLRTGVVAHK